MTFEIAIGSAGALLLGIVGYFLKTRDRRLMDLEREGESHTKDITVMTGHLDTIGKRLSAGADSFRDITQTQKQLQQAQTDILLHFVEKKECKEHVKDHRVQHDKLDRTIDNIQQSVSDMRDTVRGIEAKLEGGIHTMSSMLAKVVKIGGSDE